MNFWEAYNKLRNQDCFLDNFLLTNNIVKYDGFLEIVSLETNHTFDGRESRAVASATVNYEQEIYKVINIDYGLDINAVVEDRDNHFSNFSEFVQLKQKDSTNILENKINDCKIILEHKEYNNYKKEMSFMFDFQGDMHDSFIFDYNSFQVAVEVLAFDDEAPYWGKLLVQASHIIESKQFDLAFLLVFTAFENLITLLGEEYEGDFYKEVMIKKMELKNKIKFLLKHILGVQPSKRREDHPSIGIIEKLFSDLYILRNKVAHGSYRDISNKDCQDSINLFIIFYTAILKKPKDNNELLKHMKDYAC